MDQAQTVRDVPASIVVAPEPQPTGSNPIVRISQLIERLQECHNELGEDVPVLLETVIEENSVTGPEVSARLVVVGRQATILAHRSAAVTLPRLSSGQDNPV